MFQFSNVKREPTAVRMLIMANIIAFILQELFLRPSMGDTRFLTQFGFMPSLAFDGGRIWQLVTHMFFHSGFGHIFFNLFALYIFGSHLERTIGKQRFFVVYFLSGIGAALFYALLKYNINIPVIGASGAVMGIAASFAYFFPNSVLLVFGIIPVRAWKLLLFYAVYELYSALTSTTSPIAHAAHFGGLIAALLFMQFFYKKYSIFGSRKRRGKQKNEEDNVIELEKDKDGWWR